MSVASLTKECFEINRLEFKERRLDLARYNENRATIERIAMSNDIEKIQELVDVMRSIGSQA